MQGCGNDFVIVDGRVSDLSLTTQVIKRLSNRNFGVGCDQFIILKNAANADVFMDIYNTDGSSAEACGNATRCVANLMFEEKLADDASGNISIETSAGVLKCRKVGDLFEVDMGEPKDTATPLNFPELNLIGTPVNVGNPHCVFYCDDVAKIDLGVIGPLIENDPRFPNKTNVEFVQICSRTNVIQRTWERGVGETLACGSGACAVAVAGVLRDFTDRQVTIELKGGTLAIEWRETDGHVLMSGPAEHVFTGEIRL
ncbi:MAG: diaminopimelate epimerase [Alphaproteobacteria bacterium]